MNNLDLQYQHLLQDIILDGEEKTDRTGTGTKSVFGKQIRHKMSEGFPLLTTKKMAVKTMMTELKWFLKGDTNIKYLVDNGCNIWNGDAFKNYINNTNEFKGNWPDTMEEYIERIKTDNAFARKWGELGPIYGKQWRSWGEYEAGYTESQIDQIKNLIEQIKTNPDSRRLMVSAWNVGELDEMVLPPCHYGFQVYTRLLNLDERISIHNKNSDPITRSSDYFHEHMDAYGIPRRVISLMWNQRSCDTFLGLPFNISSYATLLLLLAHEVDMYPGALIGNLGDVHLYQNHVDQAYEQLTRKPYPNLPKIKLSNVDILNGEFDYEILNYNHHERLVAPLSN
jgi:thymidylate synthase